jgi:drug/metabolite transporter (DMT)-like permease
VTHQEFRRKNSRSQRESHSGGIIAFTLYTKAQESLGASLTGFTLYVFTIYAAIYGFILFDENLETFHYIGTVLVFVGVYLAKKNYDTKT